MERRKRAIETETHGSLLAPGLGPGACAVCGTRDARLLVMVELSGGAAATLCGSHALMHSRTGSKSRTETELREAMAERRGHERRAQAAGDELAERLTAAFTRDRRTAERRAS
jgi:hypothetical protein